MKPFHIHIPLSTVTLSADLAIPFGATALIVFSHGSGSSRLSPRNRHVAELLQERGFATLLFDLLTEEEDLNYEKRFDIDLLTQRLVMATEWLARQEATKNLKIGYFGASTGTASALKAAAELGDRVKVVVSRGGRPDLAMDALSKVTASVLLIVGGLDTQVLRLNENAFAKLRCTKGIAIIEGASHLFEEAGKLTEVARYAVDWYTKEFGETAKSRAKKESV